MSLSAVSSVHPLWLLVNRKQQQLHSVMLQQENRLHDATQQLARLQSAVANSEQKRFARLHTETTVRREKEVRYTRIVLIDCLVAVSAP